MFMALTMKQEILDEDAYVNAGPNEMQHRWLDKSLQMDLDVRNKMSCMV